MINSKYILLILIIKSCFCDVSFNLTTNISDNYSEYIFNKYKNNGIIDYQVRFFFLYNLLWKSSNLCLYC